MVTRETDVIRAALGGFIFDMDGVLADTMPFHMQAWMEVLAEHGIRRTSAEVLRDIGGTTNLRILHRWFGRELSQADIARLEERKETLYRRLYRPALKPLAGVPEFLEEARRLEIPMAVATAAGSGHRELVLGGLGIQSFFRAGVGPEEVPEGKPDPAMFLTAAEKLALPPPRCLVFEDSLAGVEAASRAGMKAVALTTSHMPGEFSRCPAVIGTAADFTSLRPQALLSLVSL